MENNREEFIYQLLDRMRSDCEYYLGYGNRQSKWLYGKNPTDHIQIMKELFNKLPETPEWLTMEDIERYAELMNANL